MFAMLFPIFQSIASTPNRTLRLLFYLSRTSYVKRREKHRVTEFFINGEKMGSEEEFASVIQKMDEEAAERTAELRDGLRCSQECAEKISYLRSRSRWTLEKELHLLQLDSAGEPLPDVYSGEF